MGSITPVAKNGVSYALFVCGRPAVEGAKFFTQNTDEFQVGAFERPAGYEVKAHQHPERKETITWTTEFLYVEKGRAKVTVFDEDWKTLHEQEVAAGDFLVFFRGGHSLIMLEPTRLVEVKQGPYSDTATTKIFHS